MQNSLNPEYEFFRNHKGRNIAHEEINDTSISNRGHVLFYLSHRMFYLYRILTCGLEHYNGL
jgi:hypothetical protein